MRRAFALSLALGLLVLGCLAEISRLDSDPAPVEPGAGGGEGGGTGGGGGDPIDPGDAGPQPDPDAGPIEADSGSPYGLDARPPNPTCVAPARPVENTGVTTTPAFPALTFASPVLLLHAPGDATRLFVLEQAGRVKVFANNAAITTSTNFVDIVGRVRSGGEMGLLGMAFHPAFATNRQAFLSYTSPTGPTGLRTVISRFRSLDNGLTLDPATEQVLLTVDQPYDNHNGGGIAFGPDGYLYIGLGDGGSGGDPQNYAQNLSSLLGKFLRIDVDNTMGALAYAIPASNPFAGGGGRAEIYAIGLRNPWRWSFDTGTGELWAADVGQGALEEVDRIVLGGNYGWRIREGASCYNPGNCAALSAGLIDPIVQYGRAEGVSVTGGYVYRGATIPALVGRFVYADYQSGRIWGVFNDPVTGKGTPRLLVDTSFGISSFGQGLDGEVFVLDYGAGKLHRLAPMGTPPPSTFPQKLSATGCVDPADATRPVTGAIPYELIAPLWSDGASKERHLAIPDGTKVRVAADGDWELPAGSISIKTFLIGGKRVETRLFMRHPDGSWAGYSYEWDDAGTDATLLPGPKTKQVGGQTWYFPSRADCLSCHTAAAGRTLGLEHAQLNRDFRYPATGRTRNQLLTLDSIELFEAKLAAPDTLPRLPDPAGAAPLEARARALLHANCQGCHRPGATAQGPADFRFGTALADAGICNTLPQQGTLGVANARLISPGNPSQSIVSVRMRALNAWRMPPVASRVVDANGVTLIDAWISSLAACP